MEWISKRFKQFAEIECNGSSPLYENLALGVSIDEELLQLCKEGQPMPNLLFGAVHFLLLGGTDHPLKNYYSSMTKNPKDPEKAFPYFKDFCQIYKEKITNLLREKIVQTNEVSRCAYLYAAFSYVYERTKKPLALIEIGTSAGLQLLWNEYSYEFSNGKRVGKQTSKVHIISEIRGTEPFLKEEPPPVVERVGIDLHIVHEQDYPWLKALIWPEHERRLDVFEQAVVERKNHSVQIYEGDGIKLLPHFLEKMPVDSIVGVFHTHVANQIPEKEKCFLLDTIKKAGENRDIFHLYNNMWDRKLHLDLYQNGVETNRTIGETDGHGRWFEWSMSIINTQ
ncbi:hypothetical protein Q73_08625 [Bacillus coahuilensis m2-6]|uniref:DUF2332 domain-containing protein n=1 Tax=Bacillus coahuilensis TaxID=408580 RepID=UPI00075067BB|nr:DUF2332 domain-containing protein [Bacillus coahuilensis]KUP07703.1 hypothetical protein Q73_08625 [Bacillus coahuilensis m2-6]